MRGGDNKGVEMSLHRLAKCRPLLHLLRDGPPKLKKSLLEGADQNLILSLCDICLNILNGNIQISSQSKKALRKYRFRIRALANGTDSRSAGGSSGSGGAGKRKGVLARQRGQTGRGASTDTDWKRKKKFLVQRGSGPFLTALISTALGGVVGKYVGHLLTPGPPTHSE